MAPHPRLPLLQTLARRRRGCAVLLAVTLPLGLTWRLAPLHLPQAAFKYGGSALWAIAVYLLFALLRPVWSSAKVAGTAMAFATAVEFLKRLYWPPLDHFRSTLAGKLLLGRYFTYGALVAYGLAVAFAATLDRLWPRPNRLTATPHAPFDPAN